MPPESFQTAYITKNLMFTVKLMIASVPLAAFTPVSSTGQALTLSLRERGLNC